MLYLDIILTFILLILTAYSDARKRIIPNYMTLPFIPIGIINSLFLYGYIEGLKCQLWLIPLFIICFILFKLHQIGGGDAKLMLAVGSLLGMENSLLLFLITFVVAWFYCLYKFMQKRKNHGGSLKEKQRIMIPLALMMLIGYILLVSILFLLYI